MIELLRALHSRLRTGLFNSFSSEQTRHFYDGLVKGANPRGIWGFEKRFTPETIASKHSLQQHFLPQVARYITKTDKCLDLGCGPGGFMSLVAPLCQTIVGADIAPHFISECKAFITRNAITNASAIMLDNNSLPFADGEFDVVLMIDTIHHLEAPAETLAEIARVLKPQGRLLIFEPNKYNPLLALLCALDKNEHGLLKLGTFARYQQLLGNQFTIDEQRHSGLLVGPDSRAFITLANFLSHPKNTWLGWLSPKLFIVARNEKNNAACRACEQSNLYLIRPSTITETLHSQHFAITDAHYGTTAALYRCRDCGLLQCINTTSVLPYYETLEDPAYEATRFERVLQAEKLLEHAVKMIPCNEGQTLTLLDVGAGSGALVEAAGKYGLHAAGIEPSAWLASSGKKRGLTLYEGTLPHPAITELFDIITLIDVIEHVTHPRQLLQSIYAQLKPGGTLLVVTPDVSSFFARILRFRWWHYRIAHITYYNKKTLALSARKEGFHVQGFTRPCWYFSYPYLRERLQHYLPDWLLPKATGAFAHTVIPLNLYDSLLMICQKK